MKKSYLKPEVEIIEFVLNEAIATSLDNLSSDMGLGDEVPEE